MGEGTLPLLRACAVQNSVSQHLRTRLHSSHFTLAVVHNGKLPFERDILFVLACSTGQKSVGSELRGVPLSASASFTHSRRLLVLASEPGPVMENLCAQTRPPPAYGHREGLNILTFKKAFQVNMSKGSLGAHVKRMKI